MEFPKIFYLLIYFWLFSFVVAFFEKPTKTKGGDLCFCQLRGQIDDCSCNVDTVDYFNNMKIYPRLQSLLKKDYFRYYKVNLNKMCPFWADDSKCAIKYCHVEACSEQDIPDGIRGKDNSHTYLPDMFQKYSEATSTEDCRDIDKELGYLNTTISAASYQEFELWKTYDDSQDNFCMYDDDDEGSEYVDLLLNPERYTGYKGRSAHRVWHSIYMENCFRPEHSYGAYIQSSKLNIMCLEKRVFYRVISGLHSSINIHLCSNYLISDKNLAIINAGGSWGPNVEEFNRRFNPKTTNGEGPQWLKNLYFIYLLELRALAKAAPYLEREEYFTGNDEEDEEVRLAVKDLVRILNSFPQHFNESVMFNGGQDINLKAEFKRHFRNISQIMDCVGCDKCKLWGKLQMQGLGTALKILFSGKFDDISIHSNYDFGRFHRKNFHLTRSEVVSLFNAFGRLSTSIFELEEFRKVLIDVTR